MSRAKKRDWLTFFVCIVVLLPGVTTHAQTTAFTYQGKLSDAGAPANGAYDLEFKLFDAGGNQVGAPLTREDVAVANGSFTVELDFGASPFTTGAASALEIGVRPGASAGAFTTLAPRQQLNSSPYSIQTVNAQQLGGLPASQYVKTDDPRLTDGLPPAPGSNNYVQNTTTPQASANFNIGGNGVIGGQVGIGTATPQSKLTVNANGYGLTHTNGGVTVGTFLTTGSGWLGTRSNHPLQLFTNDGGAQMTLVPTGEVGVGVTPEAGWRLDVGGNGRFRTANGNINFGSPNGETGMTFTNSNRADIRFDASGLKLLANAGTGIPPNRNGVLITPSGNVSIGYDTPSPTSASKLQVQGNGNGPAIEARQDAPLTPTILVANASPLGDALHVSGTVQVTGSVYQDLTANGVVKAMIYVDRNGTRLRCYNGVTKPLLPGGCATVTLPLGNVGVYRINFGFQVSGRFVSVTPQYASTCNVVPIQCRNAGANFVINGDYIEVFTFNADNAQDTTEAAFMLIVF